MSKIELKFDKMLTRLAGNEYGSEIFNNQVKKHIDWNAKTEIVFPKNIDRIAISFIQGFAKGILQRIDKNNIEELLVFKASSKELEEKILNNIKF